MKDKRLKVLFISHDGSGGGAQRCLALLLESIDRHRFKPVVVTPNDGEFARQITRLGIVVHYMELRWFVAVRRRLIGKQRLHFCRGLRARVDALAALIERENIDVVFTNTSVMMEGALAAALTGRPHLWHVLEMMSADPDLTPIMPLPSFYSTLVALSDEIAVVSRAVADDIRRHQPDAHIRVIHTGIHDGCRRGTRTKADLFGLAESDRLIAFLGFLSIRKGILPLVDAMPAILSRMPQAHLVIAGGEAGLAKRVRRRIRELRINAQVKLLGQRSDAQDIISVSDVVVVPSLSDPLPVVVLEAMAGGKAVVGTRSGGCEDMIVDGETGYLVAPGDASALADAIVRMLQDAPRCVAFGEAGRERLRRNFSVDQYVESFQTFIATMTEQREKDKFATMAEKRAFVAEVFGSIDQLANATPLTLLRHRTEYRIRTAYRAGRKFCRAMLKGRRTEMRGSYDFAFWT